MKKVFTFVFAIASFGLLSCNSNDDALDQSVLEGSGITITDDVDCCSAEEALQVYKFLQTVKIIPELSTVVDGRYNVFAYSKSGSFRMGYNDIYFVATKKSSGNYIKNFNISNFTPLMHMVQNDMYHSTPVSAGVESFDDHYLAVKKGWVSFLMNTSEMGTWSVSYDAEVLKSKGSLKDVSLHVEALADGQQWLKSFKVGDETYYISLVNPKDWKTGTNTAKAYISKKSSTITLPYTLAEETFTIDFEPTMPDMGGHSSPDNVGFTKQADGSYQGVINLTMTGYWKIDLTVKDSKGNIVAKDISFDVTI